jgi:serine/threonine-protein kinase PknG
MNCTQAGCTGTIVEGYCDVCGMAPARPAGSTSPAAPAATPSAAAPSAAAPSSAAPSAAVLSAAMPGAGPASASTSAAPASRRSGSSRVHTSGASRLGAGLVEVPSIPARDPSEAVMANPMVPESRRFCARCDEPVGRGRDGVPGRTSGFCRKCGAPFSFEPKLRPGEIVGGQYEVVGCLAHGGMGWIFLAKDRNVSDRWVVLKGLLNTGDDDAMAAALAERRFLAEVEHPNIVKIFNFVQHESSGYIVMEYVGGRSLKQIVAERRGAAGGEADPLPTAQAIAYMLEILPALGYLHELDLMFCDFKLDNVIQTRHSLKLIDLGGVYRIDEPASAVFGTVGYQAPEIASAGPSVPSDLFTVARTLAVLCFDFRGYQGTYKFTLPAQDLVPLFERFDSLYRFLLKGTAPSPDDRFQSAEEMADQLYGVLREVVAVEEGHPVPGPSKLFTAPLRAGSQRLEWRQLPRPQVAGDDPGAGYLATITATDPRQMLTQLRAAPEQSVEIQLRLAATMIELADWDGADDQLAAIESQDAWEWRTSWYRGIAELVRERPAEARTLLETVYRALPGELAPKLALGVACELASDHAEAGRWYDTVSRTDPAFTGAVFGLARCRLAMGDRDGALAAYERVPDSSSAYVEAQTTRIRCLGALGSASDPTFDDLLTAGSILESLQLEGEQRVRLAGELLETALRLAQNGAAPASRGASLLGHKLVERDLRLGVERSYRTLARGAASRGERIRLVDRANQMRPRTWT